MFTIEKINREIDKYNIFTKYSIPYFEYLVYGDYGGTQAKILLSELKEGIYKIYINNTMNKFPQEYQNSVLWHEFTHVRDFLVYSAEYENNLNDILKSYSEVHAENIKLRYLLHLNMKQTIGSERRLLLTQFGKRTVAQQYVQYVETSILELESFISTGNPHDIDHGLSTYFHFCALIKLHNTINKSSLFSGTIIKYPNTFQMKLTELYKHINSDNIIGCAEAYNAIMMEALQYSCDHYSN